MNRNEERRLILGLLSGRDPGLVREESLRTALDAIRHESQRRRVVRFTSLVGAPLLLGLGLFLLSGRESGRVAPIAQAPRPTAPAVTPSAPGIEPIEDQELLALLAGKTVALIGPPGRERLLVFDAPGRLR